MRVFSKLPVVQRDKTQGKQLEDSPSWQLQKPGSLATPETPVLGLWGDDGDHGFLFFCFLFTYLAIK